VYGYFVFGSAKTVQPSIYLRLPFPFVISLFYGYFAQVERIRRIAREREEQVKKQQKTAEAIRRQRERLEVLHEVNLSITSTINIDEILDGFLERALIHLPYAAAIVRLRKPESKMLETAASKGIGMMGTHQVDDSLTVVDQVVEHPSPLVVRNVFADPRMENLEFFKEEGLVSLVCVPLLANGQMLGNLVFFTREEHDFGEEEIGFLSTLAGQAAIAIHHSQLFIRSQNQADELRHAHRIKDEFLSSVSNELKTPLSVISGYTDMFMEGLIGTLTPIQEKAVETIARQSKELQRLIDTVLQVSTLAAEQLQAELHDVNLWEFFSELRSNYDDPLAKNVRLVWEYAADLPTVQGDRVKLKHILTNLINNAIKFTNHGTITVSVRYLASKKTLELSVKDTGIGIPKDQLSAIFERFRQVQDAQTRIQHGGVGLGLYIVKKYVDFLGGTIHVESHPGEGSVFTLRIPAPEPKLSSAEKPLPLLGDDEKLPAISG
jgi:signal transduction histidine kinase